MKKNMKKNMKKKNDKSFLAIPASKTVPVVPLGSPFQADLPTLLTNREDYVSPDSALGTVVWPVEESNLPAPDEDDYVGKGRVVVDCNCNNGGKCTSECVKNRVTEEKDKLKLELGKPFSDWKFNEMGEEVSTNWNQKEQKNFNDHYGKCKITSGPKVFFKSKQNSKWFQGKTSNEIVKYNFNVYLPRNIGEKTRLGTNYNTDNEEEDLEEENLEEKKKPKRKRTSKGEDTASSSRSTKRRRT